MIAGPVADRLGIQAWFLASGLLCILMSVAGLFVPALMHIEEKRRVVFDRLGTGSDRAM